MSNLNKLAEAIELKKKEISELQNDIALLEEDTKNLKSHVVRYNDIKQKVHSLKKQKKEIERKLDTVIDFIKNADEHYLDNTFPLFKHEGAVGAQDAVREK